MFAKQQLRLCHRILSSTATLRCATQTLASRTVAAPIAQSFFSTDAKAKQTKEEIQQKVKEASEKANQERAKEASELKAKKEKQEPAPEVVKQEECFTTVKTGSGEEITVQTKATDSNGKQPVEEKVIKVIWFYSLDHDLACR